MEVNTWAVVAATVAQFVVGMIWYTGVFGKVWGEMHGFDKLSKEVQKEMMSKMAPFYGAQLIATVITAFVLAKMIVMLPDYSPYALATLIWIGFVVPTQFSAVAFGGTEAKWIVKKMLIMTLGTLACLLVGAAVIQAF
ncbi:hypothetical protein BH11PAT4_BH11PAT4_5360 [soil metagenome]